MMKKEFLLLFLSTIIFVTMFATRPTQAQPPTEIGTNPTPCTAPVGTRFNVNITIVCEEVELFVWQFNMTFNPTVLAVVNVTEGPFLHEASGYPTMWAPPQINNETGWVGAGCTLKTTGGGFPPFGAIGSGEIANITFYVKAEGKSDLHFTGVFPGEPAKQQTFLRNWDPIGKVLIEILFTPKDGFFQYPLVGVLFSLGKAYGSTGGPPPSPNWNPSVDFNKDNYVDSSDLTTLSEIYGKS